MLFHFWFKSSDNIYRVFLLHKNIILKKSTRSKYIKNTIFVEFKLWYYKNKNIFGIHPECVICFHCASNEILYKTKQNEMKKPLKCCYTLTKKKICIWYDIYCGWTENAGFMTKMKVLIYVWCSSIKLYKQWSRLKCGQAIQLPIEIHRGTTQIIIDATIIHR